MRIKLSKLERATVSDPDLYPGCLSYFTDYDHFFKWGNTRQGHCYWEDKVEDEDWPWFRKALEIHNSSIRKNLTHSDKLYLSLLAFSRKHNILVFEFSNESQAPGL